MKRRKFLTNIFGLASLLGLKSFGRQTITNKPGSKPYASLSSIKNLIERGDIHRKRSSDIINPWIPLYQSNGRFGSCFGPWGLHTSPDREPGYNMPGSTRFTQGSTRFTHMQHFIRGKYNADYLLPIANIYWEIEPREVKDYEQYQSFYNGTVTTRFKSTGYEITTVSWFDPVQKNIAGFKITAKGNCPAIIISPLRSFSMNYDQHITPVIEEKLDQDLWQAEIKCHTTSTIMKARSTAKMDQMKEGLKLSLNQGVNEIVIAINDDSNISADESLNETKSWWHTSWENSGWLDLPDDAAQKVWVRSLAYTLYSHNDDGIGGSPPTGLAGNAWPFPFPFDSSCRHLLLLSTGQVSVAKKWIEFWHSRFEGLKAYTKRFYNSDGIFMPHVFPYGSAFGYHDPEVPNHYYYPIYNSALMVRLAEQTAIMVNDPEWSKSYAIPLIGQGARFYLDHLKKGEDGFWHLHLIPSISLDESGDTNKPDYFSGLVSAQFALQKAIEYGLDNDHRMQRVLRDGLAFSSLVGENGIYQNHLVDKDKDLGKQKHPDQLFPLVHTPLGPEPDEPVRKAHQLRYEIADGANEYRFIGHTLGEFILSSARMHDVEGWRKDWSMILPERYSDPDLIQFYESTGNDLVFYITTHGLFAQALLETTVSTWWNQLDLGSCIPWQGTVRFGNIRTLLGVTVSGEVRNGTGKATLHAWKDTDFKYEGQTISLKKNEEMTVKI